MIYNVAKFFCGLQDGEKMVDLSQTVSRHIDTRTHTHGHTSTIAIGENATRCILPKIKEQLYEDVM